jgi:peptide/nickel transport system permease protein
MHYALRRLGFYLIAFVASLTINFFLPRLAPGDPAATIIGGPGVQLTQAQLESVRAALGLSDAPLHQQFLIYLTHVVRFDFGLSYSFFPAPVTHVIASGLYWTLLLSLTSLLLSFALGNLLGIFSAWRRRHPISKIVPPLLIFFGAFPGFFLALAAVYYLGYQLQWFPTLHAYDEHLPRGFNLPFLLSVLQHLVLPALVIMLISIGGWALGMRNAMITILAEDYITMAEAKGLRQHRIMFGYAARNAVLPSVTGFGLALGFAVSGQVLIEQVFAYPGLGFLLIRAVNTPDYPLMQGLFMMITTTVLVANFVVDLLYTRLDPRVRAG